LRAAAVRVGRLGSFDARLWADLEILDRTEERFALERSIAGLVFAALPVVFTAMVASAEVEVSGALILMTTVVLGAIGFFVPVFTLRNEADRRRRSAQLALGAYLDVVAIQLAGGAGPTSALADAAAVGHGWLFRRLDRAMRAAAAA